MPLRALTTGLLVFGIGLMLGYPFVLRRPPQGAPGPELREFAARALAYLSLTVAVWLAVAVSALLVVVRSRRELARAELEQVRGLVEGSLDDHAKR
jgi:hypothetical protein